MKFCVIGDSWAGCCEYNQDIVDDILKDSGHEIINLARSGSSNHGQLQNLQHEFLDKKTADYIIWFHSEPARDYTCFVSLEYSFDNLPSPYFANIAKKNLIDDLHYLNTQNYQLAQDLYNQYQIPFVVIGGAAPLSPSIENFNFYKFKIDAWNKEISEFQDLPWNCYTHHLIRMLDHNTNYKSQQAYDELEKTNQLEIFMRRNKKKYPDTAHPNLEYYEPLMNKILTFLKDV